MQGKQNQYKVNEAKTIENIKYGKVVISKNVSCSALKVTAGQRSLTVVTVFVTAEKICLTVTMTANT